MHNLIGVSIPRSGHHLLTRLLNGALIDKFFYCEWYGNVECCRNFPCSRTNDEDIIKLQKNHDFDFCVPKYLPEVTYIVQYRPPIPVVLSQLGLVETHPYFLGNIIESTRYFEIFLAEWAVYYIYFLNKWIEIGAVEINYNDLVRTPDLQLYKIQQSLKYDGFLKSLNEDILKFNAEGERYTKPIVPSKFINERFSKNKHRLFCLFESCIFNEFFLSFYGDRHLDDVNYRETRFFSLFHAFSSVYDGNLAEAVAAFQASHHKKKCDFIEAIINFLINVQKTSDGILKNGILNHYGPISVRLFQKKDIYNDSWVQKYSLKEKINRHYIHENS